ncbi:MAG: 50S ribosomal protein L30e [Candidatus Bathyarchaeota archaeon]|nr:50S ribosomal protein L30e [Candidatus Bathyarchaeota archaeon]MDH5531919.1 50S ribosomal protein L30e [Candidatus Bathyarchaeota archaeon]MDH5712472.1 50S ribosomal protein L30e [Candidatus Bathyarchaeota archaeon]
MDINKAIATTVKTGKVSFGANNAVKNAKIGKAKLIIVAANCPQKIREDIEYYCKLSDVPIVIYKGTSIDLGAVCGKPFMVSALTIREQGDSDILKLTEAANV